MCMQYLKCCTCIVLKLLSHLSDALVSSAFECSTIMKLVVGFLKLHSKFGNSLLLYLQNEVFLALRYEHGKQGSADFHLST